MADDTEENETNTGEQTMNPNEINEMILGGDQVGHELIGELGNCP